MNTIINQILILFIIMGVGFYARKKNLMNPQISKGLGDLLLNITLPAVIITSFNYDFSMEMLTNVLIVLMISLAIHTVAVVIGRLIYNKFPDNIRKVLRFTTVFANCAFMGFPLLEGLYGKIGIFYGSIYLIVFNLFLWTVGIVLFTGEKNIQSVKKALINPGIIAVVIGVFLFVFSIKLPFTIQRPLDMVGGMTTPVSMLIVGAMLADMKIKDIFSGFSVYYGAIIRLLVMPAIVLVILKAIGISDILLGVCVAATAMPAAASTTVFADIYGGDAEFASQCVFITTLLSGATIPLMMWLVNIV